MPQLGRVLARQLSIITRSITIEYERSRQEQHLTDECQFGANSISVIVAVAFPSAHSEGTDLAV